MSELRDAGITVEIEVRVRATPEEVFPYLVDPALHVRWQGLEAELDPRPGGLFRIRMTATDTVRGEYVAVEPPDRVVFTWGWEGNPDVPPGSTTVEITLVADGESTVVRLRHSGLPDESSAAMHRAGWELYSGRLAELAGGGDLGPDPNAPA